MNNEREKFEDWVSNRGGSLQRHADSGRYMVQSIQLQWTAWLHRAALDDGDSGRTHSYEIKELRKALEHCVAVLKEADMSTGYCCCGDTMDHGFDGHYPVDMGDYHQHIMIEDAEAVLANTQSDNDHTIDEGNKNIERLKQCRDQLATYPHCDTIPAAWQRDTVAWACNEIRELRNKIAVKDADI